MVISVLARAFTLDNKQRSSGGGGSLRGLVSLKALKDM